MEHSPWLSSLLVYLAAAVLAVPLARLLGLGAIIGYLGAGIAIGPWGLKLVTEPTAILHFAEFGVVLMLFLVGLELEPRRLWAMRRPIFGGGSVQLLGSAALMLALGLVAGVPLALALVAGLGLAMSSTAIGLGALAERNLMATRSGQSVLSVALLQDIAAIPVLALVPLLAVSGVAQQDSNGWLAGGGQGLWRDCRHHLWRPAAAAPVAALDRRQRHARDLHRRCLAVGGGHRRADAIGRLEHGAGRFFGRCAAGRE